MKMYQCALTALGVVATGAGAQTLNVTIENTMSDGQFYFTPVWLAFHNGDFDSYDGGDFAFNFPGISEIAENGNTGPLSDRFDASGAGHAGGVQMTVAGDEGPDGAPVFAPGETKSLDVNVADAMVNRYFSYASMVVPTNDLFFANGDPFAHEIFDAGGNFTGPVVIEIYGQDVNDNGTEVNNAFGDAAFSANDGQAMPEFAVIRNFFTDDADAAYLDSFVGTDTAIGTTIGSSFGADNLIARITIVPAPGTLALAGLGLIGLRRRR